jgi:PAS domain S-box-containing protein
MPMLTRELALHVQDGASRRREAQRFVTQATAIAVGSVAAVFFSLLYLRQTADGAAGYSTFDAILSIEFVALVILIFLLRARLRQSLQAYERQFELFNTAVSRLTDTSELLRAVLDNSPVAIIAMDNDLRVLLWNAAAERLFGWRADEVIGRPNPITAGRWGAESAALRRQIREEGHIHSHRTRRSRKDGSDAEVAVAGALLRDERGDASGYIIVSDDLSERMKLEAQLRQAQKMEAIGQLAGGIAHDFNNLLTVILSYSEILLMRLRDDRPSAEALGEIRGASERAASLTRQLLAFSRRQVLRPRVIDLNDSVQAVERMLRRVLGEDIQFETRLDPQLGATHADPGQIEQVLVNLVLNARDAMPQGGRLTIETANAELDETFMRQHATRIRPGRYVSMIVSDTGIGMDPATREHIFEPFFTTKEPGKGTGLGLSTVIGIVEQSGGSIFVYSEPNHGTTFKIYLPLIEGAVVAAPTTAHSLDRPRGNETVLLVEDDAAVRKVTSAILRGAGYSVLEAENGEEAIAIMEADHGSIDLVITDVVMPRMGGPEFWRAMRDRRFDPPVLYISGYARSTLTDSELDAPNASFIEKPFTAAALLDGVRELLDRRS